MADLVLEVPTIGERTFIPSPLGGRFTVITAEDLEAGWSRSPDYRPPDLSRSRLRKIRQFEAFLAENRVIESGAIRVTAGGPISCRDGRHRIRVLLGLGMAEIPVTVDLVSLDFFEQYYG